VNSGTGIIGPVEYEWTRIPPYQDEWEFDYYKDNFPFVVDGSAYCLASWGPSKPFKLNSRTKKWEEWESDFDFSGFSYRYLFSYGSKIYYNFIQSSDGFSMKNIGSFDMNTSIEQERAQLPVDFPYQSISFVIGNKGYLMGGRRQNTQTPLNQIWEYDFDLNKWTSKGTMPGGARAGGVGFVIGSKVYFGLGYDYLNLNGQNIKRYRKDWLVFDPASGTSVAASLADFPGALSGGPRGFSLNNKIYIGYGYCSDNEEGCYALWEYNIGTGKWLKKSVPQYSTVTNFFTLGNAGYMVMGSFDEFWRYSTTSLVPTNAP
jgi:hypothetical protein